MYLNHYGPYRNGKLYLAKQNEKSPDEFYIYGELIDVNYSLNHRDNYAVFEAKTQVFFEEGEAMLVRLVPNSPLDRKLCTIDPSKVDISKELKMLESLATMQKTARHSKHSEIKRVIFNNPATIVFWIDGSKTVVKRALGDQGNYYNEFRKWLPSKEESTNA